jgi:hypothetical protein
LNEYFSADVHQTTLHCYTQAICSNEEIIKQRNIVVAIHVNLCDK